MRHIFVILCLATGLLLSGCQSEANYQPKEFTKVGIVLSNGGLGDQSFNDAAFNGLTQARNKLNILFDYREISDEVTYEDAFKDLAKGDYDLIVGLGFEGQEALETVAKNHSDQQFLLVDSVSKLKNVTSLTFKEHEGSYLAGVIAGMKTKSDVVGFVGGEKASVIKKFESGFQQGVKKVNPDAEVLIDYTGTFNQTAPGKTIAESMINQKADVLFAAAGLSGVGMIKAAQENGVYAIGVDSDQFHVAEKAVMTSMMKRVDTAMYTVVQDLVKDNKLDKGQMVLGLNEEGVSLAPIRVTKLTEKEKQTLQTIKKKIKDGTIVVKNEGGES
ncbi:BMP family lipoprotein [Tuberibacillus sp. Marseille-P3662]|uniref:BMP family lipoprotein n=1 Tax=Tuberibacillus sp. Marseille-P3662 TaxID=1965358 RepID=UPI000A1CA50B|nr:BMP family ABC transporter substrate-binding protein [Tuberibacillus sp. Marseille-P3662]